MRKSIFIILALISTCACSYTGEWAKVKQIEKNIIQPVFRQADYVITDYGAVGDGQTDAVKAINTAIDSCAVDGGGRVVIPAGNFFCKGSVFLKSNVNLHFADGARLTFSGVLDDFLPAVLTRWEGVEVFSHSPMIYGYGLHNIAITGKGVIDGRGSYGIKQLKKEQDLDQHGLWDMGTAGTPVYERIYGEGHILRPAMVELMGCSRILLEDVQLVDCTFWSWHLIACNSATLRRISVDSPNPNNDGVDPESSSDVLIEDCTFRTGDDGIAIKSGRDRDGWRLGSPTENVIVRNCTFNSNTNSICIGSEISGGIQNIFVENCRIIRGRHGIYLKSNRERGGFIYNVNVRNIQVDTVSMALVIIDADYHSQTYNCTTPIRDINISDIDAGFAGTYGIFLSGFDNRPLENVSIRNLSLKETPEAISVNSVSGLKLENVIINGSPVSYPSNQ